MVEGISLKQNSPENLNCLAAQRALYSNAKYVVVGQILFGVPITVGASIVAFIWGDAILAQEYHFQQTDLSWFVAFLGVIVTLLDFLVFTPWSEGAKEKAAKIQELFDCVVLEIPWNDVTAGEKPDFESINKYSKQIRDDPKKIPEIKDWYPGKLDELPTYVSRVICQRANLRWDGELRKEFSFWAIVVTAVLFVLLLVVGLYFDLTLKKFFLLVLSPTLPMVAYAYRQWVENRKASQRLDELKGLSNNVWQEILTAGEDGNPFLDRSRKLQDQIFESRKNNPLIFDWFYSLRRSAQQAEMFYSTDLLIEEYKAAKRDKKNFA